MSIKDKITGRIKKASGSLLGDRSLEREGIREERKAEAKDDLSRSQEDVERQAARVAELERDRRARP